MIYAEFLRGENEVRRGKLRAMLVGFSDAAEVKVQLVKQGENIMNQGEKCKSLLLLLSGRACAVSQHTGYNTYVFDEFGPMVLFGEQEILSGIEHVAVNVRAKTDCRLLSISVSDYLRWIQSDSRIMQRRMRSVLQTLFSQIQQERAFLFQKSGERMDYFLVEYYEKHVSNAPDGRVTVRQTRNAIAEQTGFSQRTVNRNISRLYTENKIELVRGKIVMKKGHYEMLRQGMEDEQ